MTIGGGNAFCLLFANAYIIKHISSNDDIANPWLVLSKLSPPFGNVMAI